MTSNANSSTDGIMLRILNDQPTCPAGQDVGYQDLQLLTPVMCHFVALACSMMHDMQQCYGRAAGQDVGYQDLQMPTPVTCCPVTLACSILHNRQQSEAMTCSAGQDVGYQDLQLPTPI